MTKDESLKQANDIAIGVDVTKEGTHVVAMRLKPNGVNEVIYSQFHPIAQPQERYTYGTPLLDAMVGCPPCNNHCNQGRTCPNRQTRKTTMPSLDKEFDTLYEEYKTERLREQIIQDMREKTDAVIKKINKEAQDIKNLRNNTLEEVATRFDYMTNFGDTASSFAVYVRNMKT